MLIDADIIVNADDFGLNSPVNKAILFCFENEYINSATLLTNTAGFDEAVHMIQDNACIRNVGVHVNLAEGKPLTNIATSLLKDDGNWDLEKTGKAFSYFTGSQRATLWHEINAQINKALDHRVQVTHLDSHYHLHTLPALNNLFLRAAKRFNLKLRLAQTYREGNYLKYWYRLYINRRLINNKLHYSQRFESVPYFLNSKHHHKSAKTVELMIHPAFDAFGNLTDHVDNATMENWLNYLNKNSNKTTEK